MILTRRASSLLSARLRHTSQRLRGLRHLLPREAQGGVILGVIRRPRGEAQGSEARGGILDSGLWVLGSGFWVLYSLLLRDAARVVVVSPSAAHRARPSAHSSLLPHTRACLRHHDVPRARARARARAPRAVPFHCIPSSSSPRQPPPPMHARCTPPCARRRTRASARRAPRRARCAAAGREGAAAVGRWVMEEEG